MLRFIALTILAYFIFRYLDRMFGGSSSNKQKRENTKTTFGGRAPRKSKVSKDVGEYVAYEEVKDEGPSEKK